MKPEKYCKEICQYRGTIVCDDKLRCCPFWDYHYQKHPSKP